MDIIKSINNLLRFGLEVTVVFSLMYFGLKSEKPTVVRITFGILIPLIVIILWSVFMAPKSPNSLMGIRRIIAEILIFTSVLSVIYVSGEKNLAKILGIIIFFNTVLIHIL